MSYQQSKTQNILLPPGGGTHVVVTPLLLTAGTPQSVNWNTFRIDNFAFTPQGAYIDNRNGTVSLVLTSFQTGFTIIVPAGVFSAVHFPAAFNDIYTATGNTTGTGAVIYWVDYPIEPYTLAGSNSVAQVVTLSGQPISVNSTRVPSAANAPLNGNLSAGNVTTAAPAGNLRLLELRAVGITAAAVGIINVNVSLNGVTVGNFSFGVGTVQSTMTPAALSFDGFAFASGGNFVITLTGTAITAGGIYYNAWFV